MPKPEKLADLPRCAICRLGVEIEKRPNPFCWHCWKVCIRPDKAEQYGELIEYATARAEKIPGFHGKYFTGEGRPVVVIRASSEEERDMLFASILEDLARKGLYPANREKRWWRRGCDRFDPILGKWKMWGKPVPLGADTTDRILEILKGKDMSKLREW